jgi:hypothetical protein
VDEAASEPTAKAAAANVLWTAIMTRDHTLAFETQPHFPHQGVAAAVVIRDLRIGVIVASDPVVPTSGSQVQNHQTKEKKDDS